MKCLPKDKIPLAGGMVLHDSHAEGLSHKTGTYSWLIDWIVLAIRGLNWYIHEI